MYTDLFSEGAILKNHSSLTEVLQKYSTVRGPYLRPIATPHAIKHHTVLFS